MREDSRRNRCVRCDRQMNESRVPPGGYLCSTGGDAAGTGLHKALLAPSACTRTLCERPWILIGRSRVRRRGATALFYIYANMRRLCVECVRARRHQAHPLPSCMDAHGWQRTHVRGRWRRQRTISSKNPREHAIGRTYAQRIRRARPPTRSASMRSDAKSPSHGDFAPAAGWVEEHIGTAGTCPGHLPCS
jgi:hypothetical protein